MPHCAINEIEVGVGIRSGGRESVLVGGRQRMFSGRWLQTVRAWADRFELVSDVLVRDTADALFRLLRGDGHNFRFADSATDYYSGKGLPASASNATATAGGASGKFDKRLTLDATGYVRWTPTGADALTGDYTLLVWHLASTGPDVWEHWAVRSSGGTVTYWAAGANQGGAASVSWEAKLSVTAGVLQIGDGANPDVFSDLVALPFAAPDSWIEDLAAATRQFPNRPTLDVSGDVVNRAASSPFQCCAAVDRFEVVPHAADTTGGRVSFAIEEYDP